MAQALQSDRQGVKTRKHGRSNKWPREERIAYIKGLGILRPDEDTIVNFLDAALGTAPLPPPWKMHHDTNGRTFFSNRTTGASSWTHPLEPSLNQLVEVCRQCLQEDPQTRKATITKLTLKWEEEAKRDLSKWYSVRHDNGKDYYCHRDTSETMWTHPAEVLMPMHYIKIQAIERLKDETYVSQLTQGMNDDIFDMTSVSQSSSTSGTSHVLPPMTQQSSLVVAGDPGLVRVDAQVKQLENTASSLTASNTQLKDMITKAKIELRRAESSKQPLAPSSDAQLSYLESELEAEKRRVAKWEQDWSKMQRDFSSATKSVSEAERAKSALEISLAALHQDIEKKNDIMKVATDGNIASLEDTFSRVVAQREQILGLHSVRRELEEKLRRATVAQEVLSKQLADAQAGEKQPSRAQFTAQPVDQSAQGGLMAQLQEALDAQTVLRERLSQAENELREHSGLGLSGDDLQKAQARLAQTRATFQECFANVQDAEREKGAFEAKLTALQQEMQEKQARLAAQPMLEATLSKASEDAAVAGLVEDLKAARATQADLRRELEAARAQAERPAEEAAAGPSVAELEMALADERRRKERLQLDLTQTAGSSTMPASANSEALLRAARQAAERAKDRATKAESKLKKEREYFGRVWECMQDADVVKKALEDRLSIMEQDFKRKGGDEYSIKLQMELLQQKAAVKELQSQCQEAGSVKLRLEQQLRNGMA